MDRRCQPMPNGLSFNQLPSSWMDQQDPEVGTDGDAEQGLMQQLQTSRQYSELVAINSVKNYDMTQDYLQHLKTPSKVRTGAMQQI